MRVNQYQRIGPISSARNIPKHIQTHTHMTYTGVTVEGHVFNNFYIFLFTIYGIITHINNQSLILKLWQLLHAIISTYSSVSLLPGTLPSKYRFDTIYLEGVLR